MPLPELVAPTVADAVAIAQAINDHAHALHGTTSESAEGVAKWFALPFIDPAADMRLARAGDDVQGYADVSGPEGGGAGKAAIDLRVAPGREDARLLLLEWAEARAAERAGAGGVIHASVDQGDGSLRALLAGRGYVVVRSSYGMERELDGELAQPAWPAGIVAMTPREEDLPAVYAANEEAFADHWGFEPETWEAWQAFNLAAGEDPSLWCVAWDDDEVAGLAINRPRHGEDDALGWVGVLAVRRPWRRRGLGEALLRHAFVTFAARGKRRAGLGVDAENTTGAVALYERVGMRVVRRSDTWERLV